MKNAFLASILFTLYSFAAPFPAFAQELLSLDALIDEALENSPYVKVFQKNKDALWERPSQVKSWDDPRITLGVTNLPTDDFDFNKQDMTQKYVSVMQNIPLPGINKLKEKAAVEEAKGAESGLANIEIRTVQAVKTTYYDLYFVNNAIKITDENIDLMKKFVELTQSKYEVGNGLQEDILKAQVELYKLQEKMINLKQKEASIKADMLRLLNRNDGEQLQVVPKIEKTVNTVSFEDLKTTVLEENPLLRQLDHTVAQKETEYLLAKKSYYPNFSITAAYGQRDDGLDDKHRSDFMSLLVGVNIPIWFKSKQNKQVAETQIRIIQEKAQLQSEKNNILFKLNDLLAKIKKDDALVTLYEKQIIPEASQSLDADMSAYQVGRLDFLNLLNSQMTLLNYEIKLHKVMSDLEKNFAELEVVVGKRIF
jgi:cobalt-zinc-cadmium efflux system outer membrane protein